MTSPGANARSATTHSPRPGLRVVATWNRSLRYRSRASCRRGESARPSGAPLARIGLPPQSSASSRAAAARRTIASTAVTTCAFGCSILGIPLPGAGGTRPGLWALGRYAPPVRPRRVPQGADAAVPAVRQVQGRGLLQQGVSGATPPNTHLQRAAPEPAPARTDPLLRACPAPLPVTRPRRGRPGTSASARRGRAPRRPR